MCYDKPYCSLPVKYNWFDKGCRDRLDHYAHHSRYSNYSELRGWHGYRPDPYIREPVIFGVAHCIADQIYNPLSGAKLNVEKSQFVYVLLLFELVTVLVTIFFINFLERRYKQYAEVFDKRNVEMRDFTVQLSNLPYDNQYNGKELILQALLWHHLESHLQAKMEERAERIGGDELLERVREDRNWEIADINFAK